jgi:hypothetical protein
MVIEQTIEVPANRRVTLDIPPQVPTGRTIIAFTPAADKHIDPAEAVKQCCGITKRFGISLSGDDFLAMCRKDKELEDRLEGNS